MINFAEKPFHGYLYKEKAGKRFRIGSHGIEMVRLWPEPIAVQKTLRQPYWQHFKPDISIPHADIKKRIDELSGPFVLEGRQYLLPIATKAEIKSRPNEIQFLKFCLTVPEHIRTAVKPFHDRQFQMLQFIWHCGLPALDLVKCNPALSYMLAANRLFHRPKSRKPLRSARLLLSPQVKQKDMIEWLGFPPTNQVRNILRSIIHKAINVPSLLQLRQRISDYPELLKILSHLDRINAGVMRIVNDPELLRGVSEKFLNEVSYSASDDAFHQTAYALKKIMGTFRFINLEKNRYPIINSFQQIQKIQEGLHEKIYRFLNGREEIVFPSPPVEGTDTIIALTSVKDLLSEGFQQQNCAARFIDSIALGNQFYVYRVLEPERCTVSLRKNKDEWQIDELEKAGNQPVSEYTEKVIKLWLVTHQL